MRRKLATATTLAIAATASAQTPTGLIELLVGEYNNHEQVWRQDLEGDTSLARVHWRFERLGDDRVGLSRAGGQSAPAQPTWELAFAGDASAVAAADGTELACVYRWHEKSDGYAGVAEHEGDCPAELPATWHLTPDFLVAGYADEAGDVVHRARRVARYTGWVAFQKRHVDPTAADDDFILVRDLAFHDAGFLFSITDGGEPTGYAVELARLTYQNTGTAVLKLGVVDEATGTTVSYSWAQPGAERIGINLRWVQAGMTRSDTGSR